jgi:hypothetical protein
MLDLNKPIQTRAGHPVRILATDIHGCYPIAAAIGESHYLRSPVVRQYDLEGSLRGSGSRRLRKTALDLVNVPEKRTLFLNIGYAPHLPQRFYVSGAYLSRREADEWASEERIACKEITVVEGEGL